MSRLYYRLESVFGRFAIPGLVRYLVVLTVLVYILSKSASPNIVDHLFPSVTEVKAGEVWRLFTFLIIPPSSLFQVFIQCYILIWLGDMLESAWGAFRINLLVLSVVICNNIALWFFIPDILVGYFVISMFQTFPAMLFIFAALIAPNYEILAWFIIPVKLKYLAMLDGAYEVFTFMNYGSMGSVGYHLQAAMLTQLLPLFVVIVPLGLHMLRTKGKVMARRTRFESAKKTDSKTFHRCHTCGVTEAKDEHAEFRISGEDGEEYCSKCLSLKKAK